MKKVTKTKLLSKETVIYTAFRKEKGKILDFYVGLYHWTENKLQEIARWDGSHQVAHCHFLDNRTDFPELDYNEALNLAERDFQGNFKQYLLEFEQWLKKRK